MIKCNNCQQLFPENTKDGLVTHQGHGGPGLQFVAASLCPTCTGPVAVLRIVLKRDAEGRFHYEAYQPVEAIQRAFGK